MRNEKYSSGADIFSKESDQKKRRKSLTLVTSGLSGRGERKRPGGKRTIRKENKINNFPYLLGKKQPCLRGEKTQFSKQSSTIGHPFLSWVLGEDCEELPIVSVQSGTLRDEKQCKRSDHALP